CCWITGRLPMRGRDLEMARSPFPDKDYTINGLMTNTRPPRALLLLAIKAPFADRILAGAKKFELRKRLPKQPYDRVYLYVSGGGGVVGAFDVMSSFTLPLD